MMLPRHCLVRTPLPRMEQALKDLSGVRVRRVQTDEGCFVSAKFAEQAKSFVTLRQKRKL